MSAAAIVIGLLVALGWRWVDRRYVRALRFLGHESRRFNDAVLAGTVGLTAASAAAGEVRLAAFGAVGGVALVVVLWVQASALRER